MQSDNNEKQVFRTPQEELNYLREQSLFLQKNHPDVFPKNQEGHIGSIGKAIENYKTIVPEDHHPDTINNLPQALIKTLELSPRLTDHSVQSLFEFAMEKGIWSALYALDKNGSPSMIDDFHRFLVAYLFKMGNLPGLKENTELFKQLDVRLFEITLPAGTDQQEKKSVREFISFMEKFYLGMLSVSKDSANNSKNYFTLEIALSNDADHIVFYVSVPKDKIELFEKQILAIYQGALILEVPNDYNIFNYNGASSGAFAKPAVSQLMSINTYEKLDNDPLDVILNVFTKLKTSGEGASIQFLVRPTGDSYFKKYSKAVDYLRKGMSVRQSEKQVSNIFTQAFSLLSDTFSSKEKEIKDKKIDENAIQSLTEKLKSTIVETNIRIIASAETEIRAQQIVRDMQSAFNQFTDTTGNGVAFQMLSGKPLKELFKNYSFRQFNNTHLFTLNLKELATLYHFPAGFSGSPQLKQAGAKTAPAPIDTPQQGLLMGVNRHRNQEKKIFMTPQDRVRHFYVIGQTGTGKTYFLRSLIQQDIMNGDGCCFIDPHGSDVQDILSYVPKHRIDDVIYFDPAYAPRPMGLNMLEYDRSHPEQKTFVVDEMLGIFNKLFDMKTAGGPMFEQYFRNATMLVIEDPETGNTLLEISRVLADEKFRKMKISRCKNPIIVQFWQEIAGKAGGESSLANIVPYITSKFDVFLSNEIMRPIVAQEKSAFNFRDIMDNKKILLVNLSKGRLGEINANLIGLILVGKILMAALSRVDTPDLKSLAPFYLYIDEFQNVTTNSISQILSEARKYQLSLNVAHQFLAQIDEGIKNAIFGNVGSVGVFRISSEDAQYLEKRMEPTFSAQDIMKLTMGNYYLQMLANGTPQKPFNVEVQKITGDKPEIVEKLKQLSYLKYGRDRDEIENEVMSKYNSMKK